MSQKQQTTLSSFFTRAPTKAPTPIPTLAKGKAKARTPLQTQSDPDTSPYFSTPPSRTNTEQKNTLPCVIEEEPLSNQLVSTFDILNIQEKKRKRKTVPATTKPTKTKRIDRSNKDRPEHQHEPVPVSKLEQHSTSIGMDVDVDVNVEMDTELGSEAQVQPETKTETKTLESEDPMLTLHSIRKLTPLETQVIQLKQQHPNTMLVIEIGYNFRFYGKDATVASRILHIARWNDHDLDIASFPVHRLAYYLKRLVHAGYKVGVVRQTETAALKSIGNKKSAPFQRELKQLYTKSTFVDHLTISEQKGTTDTIPSESYLMCIVEDATSSRTTDATVHTAIIAIQPATGDVIYDTFEDGFMRTELETRLLHIEPCELLLPFILSKPTEKLIHAVTSKATAAKDGIRIERMAEDDSLCKSDTAALTYVSDFYTSQNTEHLANSQSGLPLSDILGLPRNIIKALATTIRYMKEFSLEQPLYLTKNFTFFSSCSHMLLNGNTMINLEVYRNITDHKERGSLFSVLNCTSSAFGRRLLKKWVGRPLVDVSQLKERFDAIEELISIDHPIKKELVRLLKQLPDIERGLCQIYYQRSSPQQMHQILSVLLNISHVLGQYNGVKEFRFKTPILNKIFPFLPLVQSKVQAFLDGLNEEAIKNKGNKVGILVFQDQFPELPLQKQNIAQVEMQLEEYLEEIQGSIDIPGLKYVNVSGDEYLLEVKNTRVKSVPLSWIKISNTKAASRFYTQPLLDMLKERERYKDLLVVASENAYRVFLSQVSDQYEVFRHIVQDLAELDCFLSLATVASRTNYVRPVFVGHAQLKVKNGRHPIIEQMIDTDYVPNDIYFDTHSCRTMILTGPNMGGKSSYIRQVALIAIMGQIGSYVPAESAELGILDAIYTRMGALDNMLTGESTFMVELHETSDIMKQATPRSLVILDELGRGTSTHDGMAIAYSVLHYFITEIKSITLFVTHYPSLGELATSFSESTVNGHMSFIEDSKSDIPSVAFLYKLVQGIATKSYGLNVARLAGIPTSLLTKAKVKSEEMESKMALKSKQTEQKRLTSFLKTFYSQNPQDVYALHQEATALSHYSMETK